LLGVLLVGLITPLAKPLFKTLCKSFSESFGKTILLARFEAFTPCGLSYRFNFFNGRPNNIWLRLRYRV
jgi:hypothetical protein